MTEGELLTHTGKADAASNGAQAVTEKNSVTMPPAEDPVVILSDANKPQGGANLAFDGAQGGDVRRRPWQ